MDLSEIFVAIAVIVVKKTISLTTSLNSEFPYFLTREEFQSFLQPFSKVTFSDSKN